MLRVRRNGFASKLDKVYDIRGNDRPAFLRRIRELGTIVQLGVTDSLGAGRVDALLPQEFSNDGSQVLVELDLHWVKRTSPGYCLSIVSGVSAIFDSI